MKRIFQSTVIPALGILIVFGAFFYDVFFAGIPYQDPTPELQASYEFHKTVAEAGLKTGGLLLLCGVIAGPFIWILSGKRNANKKRLRTS